MDPSLPPKKHPRRFRWKRRIHLDKSREIQHPAPNELSEARSAHITLDLVGIWGFATRLLKISSDRLALSTQCVLTAGSVSAVRAEATSESCAFAPA
jgi:hypothetical protein